MSVLDNEKKFVHLLRKMSEHELILPVLADVIEAQFTERNIQVSSTLFKRSPFGVHYNIDKNIILIDPITMESLFRLKPITRFFSKVATMVGFKTDKKHTELLVKSNMGIFIGAILYNGIHIYNRYNRGELIKHKDTKRWYLEFIYRNLYYYTNQLTTMPRQAAVLLYYPYLWLIFEQFELPMYHNIPLSPKKIKQTLGMFSNFNKTEVEPKLASLGLDQPTLDLYHEWFIEFTKDFTTMFYNQKTRRGIVSQEDLDDNDIKGLYYKALEDSYNVINVVDVLKTKFPSPIFRELFITSEPLAQSLFSEFLHGKASGYEEWQKISVRGLSLLG